MLIRNKRAILARGLRDSGLLRLLEKLGSRPCLLVVTYHRIGRPSATPFYDPVDSASPEDFEAQVRNLKDRFRIARLDELLAIAGAGLPVAEPTALITFDDGYRDNFDLAFPILAGLGIPATFFLATGFLDRPRLPWWDHIAYVLKQTRRDRLELEIPSRRDIGLVHTARADAIWTVIRAFMDDRGINQDAFLRHLEERADVVVDGERLGHGCFMTWDQARLMAESGMSFGSHTHGHPILARLSEADQLNELRESRRILERELGREVTALAYPYGDPGTYDEVTKRVARAAGYRLAFSARPAANPPGETDPYEVGRLGVGVTDTPALLRARLASFACFGTSIL